MPDGSRDAGAAHVRHNCAWSETEHRLFLLGLAEHGRGAWRAIASDFVTTRTATQVRAPPLWGDAYGTDVRSGVQQGRESGRTRRQTPSIRKPLTSASCLRAFARACSAPSVPQRRCQK